MTAAVQCAAAALATALVSCMVLPDEVAEHRARPPLSVTESNIADLQENVARDTDVILKFNQPLDPASLEKTEIQIESGGLTTRGRKRYDLLSRTLTFEPNGNLREHLWYKFIVKKLPLSIVASRADRDEIQILFKTGEHVAGDTPPPPETVSFEEEIYPLFGGANCFCHARPNPLLDVQLVFDTPQEFLRTSVATESKEWKSWEIISPGSHEKSYIMYKLLGDERLGLPTITGERMPPPPMQETAIDSIEKVRNWIEQGAGSGIE